MLWFFKDSKNVPIESGMRMSENYAIIECPDNLSGTE